MVLRRPSVMRRGFWAKEPIMRDWMGLHASWRVYAERLARLSIICGSKAMSPVFVIKNATGAKRAFERRGEPLLLASGVKCFRAWHCRRKSCSMQLRGHCIRRSIRSWRDALRGRTDSAQRFPDRRDSAAAELLQIAEERLSVVTEVAGEGAHLVRLCDDDVIRVRYERLKSI